MFKEVYYTTIIFILQTWFMPATNLIIRDSISDNVDMVCPPLFDDSIKNVFRNRIVACSFDSKNCSFQNNGYIQSINIPDAIYLHNSFNSSNGFGFLYSYGGQLVLNVYKTLYTDIKNFDIYITIAYYSEDGKHFGASVTDSEGRSYNSSYTNAEYLVLYDWYVLNARYTVTEADYIIYFSGSDFFSKVDDVCVFQVCKNGYTFNETSAQCEVTEATMIYDPSSEDTSTVQNLNTSEYTPLPFVSITTTKSTTIDNTKSTNSEYTTVGLESTTTGLESTPYGFESTTIASESATYGIESTTTASESTTYGIESTTTASESTTYGIESTTTASESTTYGFESTTASESTTKVFESTATVSESTAIPTEATVVFNESSSVSYESTVLNSDFTTAATITTDSTTTVPKSEKIYTEYKSEATNFTDTSTDSISAIPGSSSPIIESAINHTTTTQATTNQPPTNQTTETQITTTQVAASQTATTTTPIVLTSTSFVIVIPSNLTSNSLMKTFYIILVKLLSGSLPTRNPDSYSWDEISNHTDGMYLVGILNATKGITMFTVGAGSSRKRRDSVPVPANLPLEKGFAYSTFIKGVTVDDITVTTPYSDIVKIPNVSYITTTTPLAEVTMISNPPSKSSSTVQKLSTPEYTPLPFVSITTTESTTIDNTKSTTAKSTNSEYTTAGLESTTTGLESTTYGFKSTTTPSESTTYGFDSAATASDPTTYGFDSTTTASNPTTYDFESTTASKSTTKVFQSTTTASKSTAISTEATVVSNKSSSVSYESTESTTDSTTTVPKSEKIYTEYKSEASNFTDTSTDFISAIPGSSSPTIESATNQTTTTQATTNQATTNQATTAQATKNQATTTQTKTTQAVTTQGTATQAVTTQGTATQASTTQGTVTQGTVTQPTTTQITTTQVAASQTATTTTPIVLTSTSFVIVIPSNLTSNSLMKSFYIILVKLLSGSLPTRNPDSYSWDEISNHTDGMYLVGILNATKGITTFIVGAGSSRKRRDSVPVPANPPLEKGVAYSTFIKGVTVDDITVTTPYSVIVKVPNVFYITTTSPLNLCGSSKCSSYADCVVQNSLPVCICRQGFICEDKCITQGLCSNNAKCYIVDGHETCKCDQGYLGDGLSAPGSYGCKDPCTTVSCGSYGDCVVENSLPVCKCRSGFVCTDQCISQGLCSSNAKCLVVEGRETCQCDQGYIGDGLNAPGSVGCQSPCAKVQCGPYADCIVENNFPDCKCRAGFICGGNCTTQGLCSSNAKCSIVDGHETCICGQGFAGDGLSKPGSIGCKDAHYLELINLDSIIVTKSNVEVAAFNLSQIVQKGNLTARNLELITNIISKVVNANSSSESVINDVLTSVDTVLSLSIDLVSANKNLNLFANFISDLDALGKQLTDNITVSRKNLALASYSIERNQNPIFIYSMLNGANISLHISSNDLINKSKNLNAYIFLPPQLFAGRNETQIYSYVFLEKVFFENSSSIDSVVLSATINDVIVKNSIYPISMMFLRDTSTRGNRACHFYKTPENVWSTEGCNTTSNSSKEVLCQCNHLTNFALILDVDQSGNNPLALRIMTWIGCGISIAGLFFTILTYCLFQKLRVNVPSQILLNLCISLLITLVLFLALVEHTQPRVLCQTVASLLQFFILSTFTWMLIKGINLYKLFVKVLRSAHNSRVFMVKSYAFAWGIPLIITVATSTIKPGNLGPKTDNDPKICVVRGLSFYCGILLPICVIMLANVVLLVLVLRGIDSKSKATNKTQIKTNVRIALGCSLLLGTTWIFAILAVDNLRDVFQWLFCIFNSLQGFFIFLFYVVRNSDVKNQWRLFLGKKNLTKSSSQNGSRNMNTNSTSF